MRERMIAILVGLTLGVLLLYGLPRAYLMAGAIEKQERSEIVKAGEFMVSRIENRLRNDVAVDETALLDALEETDGARYRGAAGGELITGKFEPDPDESLVASFELTDGGTLVVTRDHDVVREQVNESLVPLVVLGLGLAGAATLVAWFVAGRATRSFRHLADAARELGRGNFKPDVPTRGVPEVMEIGAALKETAMRLDDMVRREREFSVNASHQLRTPITAMRLELEDLTYWEETTPDAAAQIGRALDELSRLNATIDDILDLAHRQSREAPGELDLHLLLNDVATRWERRLDDVARKIHVLGTGPVPAHLPVGPLVQILDVLVENARIHGTGRVTLEACNDGSHLSIRVADEGVRNFGNEVFRRGNSSRLGEGGSGIGLALAVDLAQLIGGHLRIDEAVSTTTFVVLLPRIS